MVENGWPTDECYHDGSVHDATAAPRSIHHLPSLLVPRRPVETMELGTNFAAKLEPFLLISKSAKAAAAAKLIRDATSAPGVFVFAELLELPNIQEVHRDLSAFLSNPYKFETSLQTTSSMRPLCRCCNSSRIVHTGTT